MICEKTKLSKIGFVLTFLALSMLIISGCASNKMTVEGTLRDSVAGFDSDTRFINKINVSEDDGAATITVSADKELACSAVKQPFPLSVVLVFPKTALSKELTPSYKVDSDIVSSIKSEEFSDKIRTSKIVISLKKDVSYEVKAEGDNVKVIFEKNASSACATTEKGLVKDDNTVIASETLISEKESAVKLKNSETSSSGSLNPLKIKEDIEENKEQKASEPGKPSWVNRIDFSSEDAGKSTIIIGTTKPVKYKISKASENRIQLKLINSRIVSYRQRPLITTRFESAVNRIIPVQSPDRDNTTLVSIELREAVPYFVEQTDNILQIHFEASSIPPQPFEQAKLPSWKKILEQTVALDKEEQITDEDKEGITDDSGTRLPAKKYTGEKIALDFYDTDIKNVFRILREVSGVNFAIDKDVSGKVTMAFDKPVPWDQVLDLVLKMNRLGKVKEGDILRIATLKTLEDEEKDRKDKLRAKQDAELQEDFVTAFLPVNYADAADIVKLISLEGRGTITVDKPSNTIIMKAPPIEIKRAQTIVKQIDKVTPQVIIEARVVEVTKDFTRSLGSAWSATGGPLDHNQLGKLGGFIDGTNFDTSTGLNLHPNLSPTGLRYNVAMNHSVAGTSTIGFDFSRLTGSSLLLNAQLTALETEGNAKIISSPKVLTRDNEVAKIKQGLEYPYLERDDSGGSSVKFKDIDLLLEVTPHITPDQRIAMTLKITKNDLAGFFGDVPTVSTNEVETAVLVDNGDTVVIGGIVQSNATINSSGTPWFSKIPVLGWMFKSNTNTKQDNELLVFITPKILQL